MGQPKRRSTKQGIGATRGSGVVAREGDPDDPRPLATRDTLPAPPSAPPSILAPESPTGTRRRATLGIEALAPARAEAIDGMPPISISETPPAPKSNPGERRKREAVRVDEVHSKRITIRGAAESRPRVVDTKRIARAPLESRDAFVIQLIDGTMTMSELSDASGIPEGELEGIVARLIRLGIVAM